jgi:hypothetical protein
MKNTSRFLRFDLLIRLRTGFIAGFVAILVNTGMLIAADRFHIVTARGGLLTLLLKFVASTPPRIATTWGFQQLFHIIVGVAMAGGYAILLGNLRWKAVWKGLFAALIVWIANACVVLPLIGQDFAGSRVLTSFGMFIFAIAHTIFFVLTAILYELWRPRH